MRRVCITATRNILPSRSFCFRLFKLQLKVINKDECMSKVIPPLEYVHMRSEMNSYRFEISNRRENKFCSHEVSFRLHFKTTRYFDGHVQAFHFGQCLHDILSPKMKFHFCQNDYMKSILALGFKRTLALNATSNESALIHSVSGKSCSHENLMSA